MIISSKERQTLPPHGAPADVTRSLNRSGEGRGPAILFADVCGSMRLHERLGDAAARIVIDRLLGLAARAVNAHGGRVAKEIGDEILAVMPGADAAGRAACDLMLAVQACEPQAGVPLAMHAGFHAGPFSERHGDVVGEAVNVAGRLTSYAKAGQILTTSASAHTISPLVRRLMRPLGPLDVGGRREALAVEEIAWRSEDGDETTVSEATLRAAQSAGSRLALRMGARVWTVGAQTRHLSVGRDPSCDIVTGSTQASRNHGVIVYRNGGFFYTDTSLNGSFVTFGRSGESEIRRSQILLSGEGEIRFGHTAGDEGEALAFRIDTAAH